MKLGEFQKVGSGFGTGMYFMSRERMDARNDQVQNDGAYGVRNDSWSDLKVIQSLPQSHGRVGAVQSVDM